MPKSKNHWFTEDCPEGGCAFSFRITEKLHQEQSPHQHIEIYQTQHFGRLLVLDGFIMLTERDHFIYHEMMSHPALYTLTAAAHIVIIGGGDCGVLSEVLKHPKVQKVCQVDLDERVTRLAEQYFPSLCLANHDPRGHFHFGDGAHWMQQAPSASQDLIIVDSTDPIGPGEILYTTEFYQQCQRVLRPHGILIQQSESPLLHLDLQKKMRNGFRAAGFKQLQTLFFPQPTYASGWWTATLASKQTCLLDFRHEAATAKPFRTRYYNAATHLAALQAPEFFKEAMDL